MRYFFYQEIYGADKRDSKRTVDFLGCPVQVFI